MPFGTMCQLGVTLPLNTLLTIWSRLIARQSALRASGLSKGGNFQFIETEKKVSIGSSTKPGRLLAAAICAAGMASTVSSDVPLWYVLYSVSPSWKSLKSTSVKFGFLPAVTPHQFGLAFRMRLPAWSHLLT